MRMTFEGPCDTGTIDQTSMHIAYRDPTSRKELQPVSTRRLIMYTLRLMRNLAFPLFIQIIQLRPCDSRS